MSSNQRINAFAGLLVGWPKRTPFAPSTSTRSSPMSRAFGKGGSVLRRGGSSTFTNALERILVLMPLLLLRLGSVLWSWLLRLVASFGHHRRAMARVAIRHEGQTAVLAHRGAPLMWFHVASLGELEQAIPVMQAFRAAHPETPWLLTVYSPSAWHPLQSKGVSNVIDGWTDGDLLAVLPDDLPSTWRTGSRRSCCAPSPWRSTICGPTCLPRARPQPPRPRLRRRAIQHGPQPQALDPHALETRHDDQRQDEASAASFARIGLRQRHRRRRPSRRARSVPVHVPRPGLASLGLQRFTGRGGGQHLDRRGASPAHARLASSATPRPRPS